jgi:hypothetical protein
MEPLLQWSAGRVPITHGVEATYLAASVRAGEVAPGLQLLATERARLSKFGVNPEELDRQKATMLRFVRSGAIADKDRQTSGNGRRNTCVTSPGEPVPGVQWEVERRHG